MAHGSDPPVDAPSRFRLRQRTDADMDALAELWAASWLEAMPGIDFAARTTWLRGHLPALEAAGAVTVCGFDEVGRLLGFATVDPQNGYLDQITVAPEAKSSGAASALLAEARRISAASSVSRRQPGQSARAPILRARRFQDGRGRGQPALGVENMAPARSVSASIKFSGPFLGLKKFFDSHLRNFLNRVI